jgi:hypothetical protein
MLELLYTPLTEVPIKIVSKEKEKQFIDVADEILNFTNQPDYLKNKNKQEAVKCLENKIDQMVYELYKLSNQEIKMITDFFV